MKKVIVQFEQMKDRISITIQLNYKIDILEKNGKIMIVGID